MSRSQSPPDAQFSSSTSGLVGDGGVTTMAGAPSALELVFDGCHVPATFPNQSVGRTWDVHGLRPFCSAGDVSDPSFQGRRR